MAGDRQLSVVDLEVSPSSPSPSPSPSNLNSSPKGKEKIGPSICGICLTEMNRDRGIRGWIDSCDHYFCFVCIMEWAKVESRCPFCKARFATIRRPPRQGVFLSDRIINVPLRDQVCHYFGNATVEEPPRDPYTEVKCSLCHSREDESLLLLCDLCDSASHTYCVGLGATVPEGDWYCQDCTVLRAEHAKSEIDDTNSDIIIQSNVHKLPKAADEERVSVFDIVQGPSRTTRRPMPSSHENQYLPPCTNFERNGPDIGARTLGRCRNVNAHIQSLRENWNALRSGLLAFSSSGSGVGSSSSSNQRKRCCSTTNALLSNNNQSGQQPHSSSCCSSQDPGAHQKEKLSSADKAWKMMDVAKSMVQQQARRSKTNTVLTKRKASPKRNTSKPPRPRPSSPKSQMSEKHKQQKRTSQFGSSEIV